MLRDWGAEKKYQHVLKGYNFRLEGIQGAVLRVKLRHLEAWTEARRAAAARYDRLLAGSGVPTPAAMPYARHVYHIYAIRTPQRAGVAGGAAARRASRPASTTRSRFTCCRRLPIWATSAGQFPHSEQAANEVLSLPMFPELTAAQCEAVREAVRKLAAQAAAAALTGTHGRGDGRC